MLHEEQGSRERKDFTPCLVSSETPFKLPQAEYMAQRAAVLEELRLAKAEAQADRQRILQRIGRQIGRMDMGGTSRWAQ